MSSRYLLSWRCGDSCCFLQPRRRWGAKSLNSMPWMAATEKGSYFYKINHRGMLPKGVETLPPNQIMKEGDSPASVQSPGRSTENWRRYMRSLLRRGCSSRCLCRSSSAPGRSRRRTREQEWKKDKWAIVSFCMWLCSWPSPDPCAKPIVCPRPN